MTKNLLTSGKLRESISASLATFRRKNAVSETLPVVYDPK